MRRPQPLLASATVSAALLLCLLAATPASALVEDVLDVIKLTKEVSIGLLETWDIIEQTHAVNEVDIPFYKQKEKKILTRMEQLTRQIDSVEAESSSRASWTINKINEAMVANTQLQLQLHELSELSHLVFGQQNLMRAYTQHQDTLERSTLLRYAEQTVSPDPNAIQALLERIHLLFVGDAELRAFRPSGLLQLIADHLEEAQEQVCSTRQSAQQVLYQLYATISLTELRGYSMMQFSWMLLRSYDKGNYTTESKLLSAAFEERAAKTQALLAKVMERADLQVWRCDPQQHVEGATYEQVTRLMQGFIENEVDLNADRKCSENCAHYQFTQSYGCYKDLYCSKQPKCRGKILNCQFVDSDMWICPAKHSSARRYEYVEYENGRVLGQKASCARGTTKVDSWWRWIFWHCSYCMCMCDEESARSDRYFSLREAVSNVSANAVVTGLRFRKLNRIIHLQVQEGQLGARGTINATTLAWRPVSEFQLTDRAVQRNVDYHTLTWNTRTIDTDDLRAPANHVLTGVRLRQVGSHMNLEIRVTEADFETGELREPSSWCSNDRTQASEERRTQVQLTRPDIPTRTRSKSIITSQPNQFVEFGPSDLDADAGQTTVPFVDVQDVLSIPAVALAGAGLYHKGQTGFGGFIAPKLFTYNFAPHIEGAVKAGDQPERIENECKVF